MYIEAGMPGSIHIDVLLDGVKQQYCVAADDTAGEAWCAVEDARGRPLATAFVSPEHPLPYPAADLKDWHGHMAVRRRGRVQFVFHDDATRRRYERQA